MPYIKDDVQRKKMQLIGGNIKNASQLIEQAIVSLNAARLYMDTTQDKTILPQIEALKEVAHRTGIDFSNEIYQHKLVPGSINDSE